MVVWMRAAAALGFRLSPQASTTSPLGEQAGGLVADSGVGAGDYGGPAGLTGNIGPGPSRAVGTYSLCFLRPLAPGLAACADARGCHIGRGASLPRRGRNVCCSGPTRIRDPGKVAWCDRASGACVAGAGYPRLRQAFVRDELLALSVSQDPRLLIPGSVPCRVVYVGSLWPSSSWRRRQRVRADLHDLGADAYAGGDGDNNKCGGNHPQREETCARASEDTAANGIKEAVWSEPMRIGKGSSSVMRWTGTGAVPKLVTYPRLRWATGAVHKPACTGRLRCGCGRTWQLG
jgi:hypothetical protein